MIRKSFLANCCFKKKPGANPDPDVWTLLPHSVWFWAYDILPLCLAWPLTQHFIQQKMNKHLSYKRLLHFNPVFLSLTLFVRDLRRTLRMRLQSKHKTMTINPSLFTNVSQPWAMGVVRKAWYGKKSPKHHGKGGWEHKRTGGERKTEQFIGRKREFERYGEDNKGRHVRRDNWGRCIWFWRLVQKNAINVGVKQSAQYLVQRQAGIYRAIAVMQ